MGPNYRVLVHRAQKLAQQYLVSVMQEYTQSGGVHPFGVSLVICGLNRGNSSAVGKNYVNRKTFLKKNNKDLELEDAICTVILTLKESFEG
ncbi:unnamed protein product [Nyctereutes procyonoides]|uniref:(raccoon dog) hypothetical protein n=1 Tax=Nyctereutes procyonoides TaxID=34880 RepID=A0A811Y6K3_NYCPR|nr:unnamed protein product [Nyctereutes procyonoides]